MGDVDMPSAEDRLAGGRLEAMEARGLGEFRETIVSTHCFFAAGSTPPATQPHPKPYKDFKFHPPAALFGHVLATYPPNPPPKKCSCSIKTHPAPQSRNVFP